MNISGTGALEDVSFDGGVPSISISGGSPRLHNVRITSSDGILISAGATPTLTEVSVTMTPTGAPTAIGISVTGSGTAPTLDGIAITGIVNGSTQAKGIQLQNVNLLTLLPKMANLAIRLTAQGGAADGVELINTALTIDDAVIEINGSGPIRGINVQNSSFALRGSRIRSTASGATGINVIGSGSSVKVDQCMFSLEGSPSVGINKPTGSSLFVGASKVEANTVVFGVGAPVATCVFTYNGSYLPLNSTCN